MTTFLGFCIRGHQNLTAQKVDACIECGAPVRYSDASIERPAPLMPGHDDPCPQCDLPVGDHTIRGWGECLHAAGRNYTLPAAEVPGGPLRFDALADDQIMVGAVDVGAGAVESTVGTFPALLFRFYAPGVDPMSRVPTPMYVLVGDDQLMIDTADLVADWARRAIEKAR